MTFIVRLLLTVIVVLAFFCWSRTSAKLIDGKKFVKRFNSTIGPPSKQMLNLERNLKTGDVIRLVGEWYYERIVWWEQWEQWEILSIYKIDIRMMSDDDNYILFNLKTDIKEDKLVADQMDGENNWLKLINVPMPFTIGQNNAFDIEILLRGDCMQVNINDNPTLCLKNKITYPQLGFNNISRIQIAASIFTTRYKIIEWYEEDLDRFSTTLKVASLGKTTATSFFPGNIITANPDFDSNVPEDGLITGESGHKLSSPKMDLISTTLILIWAL